MRIVMIGSGNVAYSLAPALAALGDVVQVYGRTAAPARELAGRVGCDCATDSLDDIVRDADLYVVCVPDEAIAAVLAATGSDNRALWVHTSGTTGIEVFRGVRRRCGVFYPMQSFSRSLPVSLRHVPLFVEGSSAAVTAGLLHIAGRLSSVVRRADSEQRRKLHLAAVFACNFANHCCALASEVTAAAGIDFEMLVPLIETTVEKLRHLNPSQSQTGPAARGDSTTIARHLAMLDGDKKDIYALMTRSIIARRKHE